MRFLTSLLAICLLLTGCSVEPLSYVEVKKPNERLTPLEWQKFQDVVAMLPDRKLPALPELYLGTADWPASRTLSVSDLVQDERLRLAEHDVIALLTTGWSRNRQLKKVLRQQRLTVPQFAGLVATIGMAVSRTTIRNQQQLDAVISRGQRELSVLLRDDRPFSSLSLEQRYAVTQRARWLNRIDRANRLEGVPRDNMDYAYRGRSYLQHVFPPSYWINPLDVLVDMEEEIGAPFVEPEGGPSDRDLVWKPAA